VTGFQGHGVIGTIDVLCAQLTRDLFAIAKFLFRDEVTAVIYDAK